MQGHGRLGCRESRQPIHYTLVVQDHTLASLLVAGQVTWTKPGADGAAAQPAQDSYLVEGFQ